MKRSLTATTATAILVATLTACGSSDKPKAVPAHVAPASSHLAKASVAAKPADAKLPTAQARKQAAAILEKEDANFRDFLAQGEKAVGTADWPAWDQKAIVGLDMQQTAFSKADGLFTASNEPTDLIEAWRTENGNADTLMTQFANDTGPELTAKSRKDASDCLTALAKADKDAEEIANGS